MAGEKIIRTDCDVPQHHSSQNATLKKSHGSCTETIGANGHGPLPLRRLWALGASTSLLSAAVSATHCATDSLRRASGSPSPVPLHLSDGTSCIVLPPVVHRCLHLRLFSCLRLLSHPHISSRPSLQVGCCVSRCLSLSLLSCFCAVPQPPPIITPQPSVGPLDGTLLFHGRTHE